MTKDEMQAIIRDALEKKKKIDALLITSWEWREIEIYLEECFEAHTEIEEMEVPE